jgi:hypothetical protein
MSVKNYSEAAVAYEKYLKILELVFGCKKGEKITPEQFKDNARTSELTVVTAEDLKQFVSDFNEMKAMGLRVPVPIEHPAKDDPEGLPVDGRDTARIAERERAKYNAGWAEDLFIENGELRVKVDLKTDSAIEQAEKVGTYISPQFGPWVAPNGKRFENAITHFALTPRPANPRQSSTFVPAKVVALSQLKETVRLSMADLASKQTQLSEGATPQQQQCHRDDAGCRPDPDAVCGPLRLESQHGPLSGLSRFRGEPDHSAQRHRAKIPGRHSHLGHRSG